MPRGFKKVRKGVRERKGHWNGEINTNKRILSVAWFIEMFPSDVINVTSGDPVGTYVVLLLLILWLAFVYQPKSGL